MFTEFKFRKFPDGQVADIELNWKKRLGDIGCANPPPSKSGQLPEDGNVFFNLDKEWTFEEQFEGNEPYDFYTLCAHELGHSIGLGQQTLVDNTLMSTHYGLSFRRTSKNDVCCYQRLYEVDECPDEQCIYYLDGEANCCG